MTAAVPAELLRTLEARLSAASKPGARDEAAFEAVRCLDAIEQHEQEPREGSADFIARQIARIGVLLGVAPPLFTADDIIHQHNRAQALAAGDLVDATEAAREYGVLAPVALTRAAWAECVTWTRQGIYQEERGRLLDVCAMLALALRAAKQRPVDGPRMAFGVMRIPNTSAGDEPERVRLVVVAGPGDDLELVLTVMLPGED